MSYSVVKQIRRQCEKRPQSAQTGQNRVLQMVRVWSVGLVRHYDEKLCACQLLKNDLLL